MATIIFIHGLNTYGDDDIHIGPLKFGPMHARLEHELRALGHQVIPITGLGAGGPREQAEQARERLEKDPRFTRVRGERVHLLGQSTGGLVARELAVRAEFSERVGHVITIGTPHHGARAAEFALAFQTSYPAVKRIFALCGYDTGRKTESFRHFTPSAVGEFNSRISALESRRPPVVSFICEVTPRDLSWPLKFFHSRLNPDRSPGDGFISSDSQRFGRSEGPFALDHFGELGFFPQLGLTARQKAENEFKRLCRTVSDAVSN